MSKFGVRNLRMILCAISYVFVISFPAFADDDWSRGDPDDRAFSGGGVVITSQTEAGAAYHQGSDVRICNRTGERISVATAFWPQANSRNLNVKGWWVVQPGACASVGNYRRGEVYLHAHGGGLVWGGRQEFCVQTDAFSFTSGLYVCNDGWRRAGFRKLALQTRTRTLNIRP